MGSRGALAASRSAGVVSVLAIDPGAETCACVEFARDVIVRASFALPPAWHPMDGEPRIVVVERMQADERTRHVDVRHVLACQWNGAFCAAYLSGRTGAASACLFVSACCFVQGHGSDQYTDSSRSGSHTYNPSAPTVRAGTGAGAGGMPHPPGNGVA